MIFRKYLKIAKTAWLEYLEYRANLFFEILGVIISFLVIIFLWTKIYAESFGATIGGYNLGEMVTYLIGAGILASFMFFSHQGDEINDDIRLGNLSNYLLKPLNPFFYWLIKDLVRKFFAFFLSMSGYILILFFWRASLNIPSDILTWALFFLSILTGSLLYFLIFYLFSIFAFWMEQTWGFRFVVRVVMEIATGIFIPVTLLPGVIGSIIQFLPFKFLAFFPMQIFLGKISLMEIMLNFGVEILWIGAFYVVSVLVWRRGIKHYTAVGA